MMGESSGTTHPTRCSNSLLDCWTLKAPSMCPEPNAAEDRTSTTLWPAFMSSSTVAGVSGLTLGVPKVRGRLP